MRHARSLIITLCLIGLAGLSAVSGRAVEPSAPVLSAEVRDHLGRPTLFVDDKPTPIVS